MTNGARRATAALTVILMFALVYARRLSQHFSNVDDYLYALQAHAYRSAHTPHAMASAWRSFSSNSPAVPTLAAVIGGGPDRMVLVQLPLLVALLLAVHMLLAELGRASWWRATAVAISGPVLSYAAQLHFGLAATLMTVTSVALYLRSRGLADRRYAILLGLALGALLLTRVMALVYAAGIALPLLRHRRAWLPLSVAAAVAAPWWLLNGRAALHYLLTAGYNQGSGQAGSSGVTRVIHRVSVTADDTGALLLIVIVAAAALAIYRRPGATRLVGVVAGLIFLLLMSSDNGGTAFALPAVTLIAALAASASTAAAIALVASTAVLLLGVPGPWVHELPGRLQLHQATGAAPTDTVSVMRAVAAAVGDRSVVVARDDAALNANGLSFVKAHDWVSPPFGARSVDVTAVDSVISGTTLYPYHQRIDLAALSEALPHEGFRLAYRHRFSRWNSVEVWVRR